MPRRTAPSTELDDEVTHFPDPLHHIIGFKVLSGPSLQASLRRKVQTKASSRVRPMTTKSILAGNDKSSRLSTRGGKPLRKKYVTSSFNETVKSSFHAKTEEGKREANKP